MPGRPLKQQFLALALIVLLSLGSVPAAFGWHGGPGGGWGGFRGGYGYGHCGWGGWGGCGIGINIGCYPWYGGYAPYPYPYPYPYPCATAPYVAGPPPLGQNPTPPPAPKEETAPTPKPVQPQAALPQPVSGPVDLKPVAATRPSAGDADHYKSLLLDTEEGVRLDAVTRLGRMRGAQAINALAATLAGDPSPVVREAAARSLDCRNNDTASPLWTH